MAIRNVIFKGKQYEVNELPEEAKQLFALLQAANDLITRSQTSIAIAETSRAVYSAKLDEILGSVPSSEPSESSNN